MTRQSSGAALRTGVVKSEARALERCPRCMVAIAIGCQHTRAKPEQRPAAQLTVVREPATYVGSRSVRIAPKPPSAASLLVEMAVSSATAQQRDAERYARRELMRRKP